tara:strand:+ start:16584 stop:17105 length:522 start_codon:yes stop_codon:yes gene_type:complete
MASEIRGSDNFDSATVGITSGTAVASTSGTSIDFTGIPAGVKRVTVMFGGVSTNGTSNYIVRLGTSSGIEATGYLTTDFGVGGTTTSTANNTTGFAFRASSASNTAHGQTVFNLLDSDSFRWTGAGSLSLSNNAVNYTTTGSKALAGTLDRIRLTTVNGTDTFDAGSINILYE